MIKEMNTFQKIRFIINIIAAALLLVAVILYFAGCQGTCGAINHGGTNLNYCYDFYVPFGVLLGLAITAVILYILMMVFSTKDRQNRLNKMRSNDGRETNKRD
jgi:uncharacterized membrane protein